jgi:hypothetical protein
LKNQNKSISDLIEIDNNTTNSSNSNSNNSISSSYNNSNTNNKDNNSSVYDDDELEYDNFDSDSPIQIVSNIFSSTNKRLITFILFMLSIYNILIILFYSLFNFILFFIYRTEKASVSVNRYRNLSNPEERNRSYTRDKRSSSVDSGIIEI